MMLRILRDRFIRLGRDEEGAALVVTLAVFMFMWLVCIGVFAIGTAVKTRIHLQNACDAAAYSAAVVQADTLSRIATVNRAMSWTYVQMTRRQMDYIVYKWLKHTLHHYDIDKNAAIAWTLLGSPCGMHAADWSISDISLNGTRTKSRNTVASACTGFISGNLVNAFYSSNGSGISKLESQIRADKETIDGMNLAIEDLADDLPGRAETVAKSVFKSNYQQSPVEVKVWQSDSPRRDYMKMLRNNASDESRFLAFSGYGVPGTTFGTGIDVWFVRGVENGIGGGEGIQRSYLRYNGDLSHRDGVLFSQWSWHATRWFCGGWPNYYHHPYPKLTCNHGYCRYDTCKFGVSPNLKKVQVGTIQWVKVDAEAGKAFEDSDSNLELAMPDNELDYYFKTNSNVSYSSVYRKIANGDSFDYYKAGIVTNEVMTVDGYNLENFSFNKVKASAVCYADNSAIYSQRYYVGARAEPRILTDSYFGEKGTISVGVAVDNSNPWAAVLAPAAKLLSGIYSAFNHFVEKTVVFASAKAGYKYLGEDPASRQYIIDWTDGTWTEESQSWNLCQSDWDAVLIPVRMAKSPAADGRWGTAGRFLYDWASELGVDVDLCFAGGTGVPPEERPKAFHEWNKLGDASWHTEQVNARWQVENNAQTLDWDKLTDRMFH